MRSVAIVAIVIALGAAGFAAPAADSPAKTRQKAVERAEHASGLFAEVLGAPDRTIPDDLITGAQTIAVFPEITKGAFIFGGTGGKGLVSVRDPKTGKWGQPLFIVLGGGSWGAQIGIERTDLILVGMGRDSQMLFEKATWKIGADAGATAGPVGRRTEAATDWKAKGGFLSYSRSKGLFIGVSLNGAKVGLDESANAAVYGEGVKSQTILYGPAPAHAEAAGIKVFVDTLEKYSPAKRPVKGRRK
jgi:lipid-binding SYLF domain-containing protein